MSAHTLDTHRIVKRLQQAGFSDVQAETMTDVVREAREFDLASLVTKAEIANLATKADIASLVGEVSRLRGEAAAAQAAILSEFAAIRSEMAEGNAAIRSEMAKGDAAIRLEMANGDAAIRLEMTAADAAVSSEIAAHNRDLLKWVIGIMLVQSGILLTAMKLLPAVGH